jgi:very-short-patch-repair endonuclease
MMSVNGGFGEQFRHSLEKWTEMNLASEYGYSLAGDVSHYVQNLYRDEFVPDRYKREGRMDEWEQIAHLGRSFVNALLVQEICYWIDGDNSVGDLLQLVESPIEASFLLSLILCARNEEWQIDIRQQPGFSKFPIEASFGRLHSSSTQLLILPQAQIGDCRVDFLLRHSRVGWASRPTTKEYSNKGTYRDQAHIERQIIVECDGHEYHEKTKEQARRDKKRDRRLQTLGFPVYRYTGSEIYKNPMECAIEITKALLASNDK